MRGEAVGLALLAAGCAAPRAYMGIPLDAVAVPPLRALTLDCERSGEDVLIKARLKEW